jgi:hypothetical protein
MKSIALLGEDEQIVIQSGHISRFPSAHEFVSTVN